ncbi:hypothetical protein PCASD_21538 [Puccinia coronata f. sp. avenae]|uniref:Uncharacterized protein n=1 Tax=Puccinia coronata f. sp. avenae TaxID=200324 RepID=A0A2N5TTA9_9BASI|nr:hypothetical protein PCASD_21538 [Puccinia coronata f. sp. avenae]
MEGIESDSSSNHSNSTPRPTSPVDFGKNPALDKSRHNPDNDNGITNLIAELLSNPRPDGSVVITADKVKDLLSLLGITADKVKDLLSLLGTGKLTTSINKMNSRLDSIEKAIKAVTAPTVASVPAPIPLLHQAPPNGWANVVKNSANNVSMRVLPRLPPLNRVINEFKSSFFVICKTVPESCPFFQMSPDQITKKVNQVLREINAKAPDGAPIIVKGPATLPSGDFKFFTQTRFAANWLLENKHKWTHLCDPNLVTPQLSL